MIGIFQVGIDEIADVLEIRAAAMEVLKAGGTVLTSWSSEGTSVTKVTGMSVSTIIQEANDFLQRADPDTYGRRVTRTRPYFL
jgi:hypothetical protein